MQSFRDELSALKKQVHEKEYREHTSGGARRTSIEPTRSGAGERAGAHEWTWRTTHWRGWSPDGGRGVANPPHRDVARKPGL